MVKPVLSYPLPHPSETLQYNQNNSKFFLILVLMVINCNSCLSLGGPNLCCKASFLPAILYAELVSTTISLHDNSHIDLSSPRCIYLAYVKLTSGRQPNASHLSVAMHKVSSG